MSDLRLEMAQEVADLIGAVLIPERCHCGWPRMTFKGDSISFAYCWNCETSRQTAERGRDLLERIKRNYRVTHVGNEIFIDHE